MNKPPHLPVSVQARWSMQAAVPSVVAGYPLLEALKTCRRQIMGSNRGSFNKMAHSDRTWTENDHDFNTPTVDLLYSNAWADLRNGPVILRVPRWDRFFVVELLDVYTNNFLNIGTRNVPEEGASYALLPPGAPLQDAPQGTIPVSCPTSLVWLLGRVIVDGERDLSDARKFQSGFKLDGPEIILPAECLRLWQETDDDSVDFFANLGRALREFPPAIDQRSPFDVLQSAHIKIAQPGEMDHLRPAVLEGLRCAYSNAMELIEGHTRSPSKAPWRYSTRLGKFGDDYMLRAATAMKGIAALSADEAIYATSDYDELGERLHGSHLYRIRFSDGGNLPVDAFWSITLYGKDRFLAANSLGRHALGSRSGMVKDLDGALTIYVSKNVPPGTQSNWLPAPDEDFYLILRLYHPRKGLEKYIFPAVEKIS